MNREPFAEDLSAMIRATERTADELISNKALINEYWRWVSRYHRAKGSGGPLGPVLVTALLGTTKSYRAPSEGTPVEVEKIDWRTIEIGRVVRATVDGKKIQGIFGGYLGEGQLAVRLKDETTVRMFPANMVTLGQRLPNGVDEAGYDDPTTSVHTRTKPPVIEKIERQAEAEQAEFDRLDGLDEFEEPTAEELAAAAIERDSLRIANQDPGDPSGDLPPRQSPWLFAEQGHRAAINVEGDWPDAEFVEIASDRNPEDLRLSFWVDSLGKAVIVSEHDAKPKTAIEVPPIVAPPAEASHAAVGDL